MSDVNFNTTTATKYLKTKYGEAGVIISHAFSPTQAMLTKDYSWTGGTFEEAVAISMGFGVGGGDQIPDAAVEKVIKPALTEKNQYVSVRISNKLIAKAKGGESAFVDAQASRWERGQMAFAWNRERQLFNDGTGSLGTMDAMVTNTDPTFVISITAATWKQFNWEIGCLVNLVRSSTALNDVFELTAVDTTNKRVTLVRQSGADVPTAADVIVMQNSYNEDIAGFKSITDLALGATLYGETVQYKYKSHVQALSPSQTIDEELLDNAFIDTALLAGKAPNYIVTSPKQWKILKSANIGLKRYMVDNPSVGGKLKAQLGFQALEYTAPQQSSKPIPIAYSQFCEDDRLYMINTEHAKLMYTGKPHWFTADGSAFARTPDKKDDMEARWCAYGNLYMLPTFHAVITGLA